MNYEFQAMRVRALDELKMGADIAFTRLEERKDDLDPSLHSTLSNLREAAADAFVPPIAPDGTFVVPDDKINTDAPVILPAFHSWERFYGSLIPTPARNQLVADLHDVAAEAVARNARPESNTYELGPDADFITLVNPKLRRLPGRILPTGKNKYLEIPRSVIIADAPSLATQPLAVRGAHFVHELLHNHQSQTDTTRYYRVPSQETMDMEDIESELAGHHLGAVALGPDIVRTDISSVATTVAIETARKAFADPTQPLRATPKLVQFMNL